LDGSTEVTFNMSGGKISNNTAVKSGGGVDILRNGEFNISGNSIISDNEAQYSGGGIYVQDNDSGSINSAVTMSGGTISGNKANGSGSTNGGGGVCLSGDRPVFTKTGGIIYGSDDTANKNAASSNNGHAVYLYIDSATTKKRNSTVDEAVAIDSTLTGTAGGWE
jgi:hypothetical protein